MVYRTDCHTAPLTKTLKTPITQNYKWSDDTSQSNHSQGDVSPVKEWIDSEHALPGAAVTWPFVQQCSVPQSVQGSQGIREVSIATACGFEGSLWMGRERGRGRLDRGRGATITLSHHHTVASPSHHHTVASPSHHHTVMSPSHHHLADL